MEGVWAGEDGELSVYGCVGGEVGGTGVDVVCAASGGNQDEFGAASYG